MRDEGYDDDFTLGVTGASFTIGPIIPPRIPFVIFGAVANVSVAGLFIGGFLPGLLMALALSVMVFSWLGAATTRFAREPQDPRSAQWPLGSFPSSSRSRSSLCFRNWCFSCLAWPASREQRPTSRRSGGVRIDPHAFGQRQGGSFALRVVLTFPGLCWYLPQIHYCG